MLYCCYYQARFVRETTWFVVGCLRAENNLVFERATDEDPQLFEFFVSPHCEEEFLKFMEYMQHKGLVLSLEQKPNRLEVVI